MRRTARESKMTPKVTIGVCVRNCAGTVSQALNSIAAQDFPHELMETILVDDGSQDDTLQVLEKWASTSDIKTRVFHDKWHGMGHVRNKVVDCALGEYIVWIDDGIIVSKDYVRRLVSFIEKHPEVGITKGKFWMSPGPTHVATLEIYSRGVGGIKPRKNNTVRSLGTGASIYRLKAIRQVGGFDERFTGYGEDWDLEIRIKEAGWSLIVTDCWWRHQERAGLTYNRLWANGVKRGYDLHRVDVKNKGLIKLYRMSPPAALLSGLLDIPLLYRNVRNRLVLLLPLHSVLKATAWYWGYSKARRNADHSRR
jgi:glycosyltransferase involved in cell wall biosynthesis